MTQQQAKQLIDSITASTQVIRDFSKTMATNTTAFKQAYARSAESQFQNTKAQIAASKAIVDALDNFSEAAGNGAKKTKTDFAGVFKVLGDAEKAADGIKEALDYSSVVEDSNSKVKKSFDSIVKDVDNSRKSIALKFAGMAESFIENTPRSFSALWSATTGITSNMQRFIASTKVGGTASLQMTQSLINGGRAFDNILTKSNMAETGARSIMGAVAEMGISFADAFGNFKVLSEEGVTNSMTALALSQDAYSFAVAMGDRMESAKYAAEFGQLNREFGMGQNSLRTMAIESSKIKREFGFSSGIINDIRAEMKDVLSTIRNISGDISGGMVAGMTRMLAIAKSLAVEDPFKDLIKAASSFKNLSEASAETAFMQYRAMSALSMGTGIASAKFRELGGQIGFMSGNLLRSAEGQRVFSEGQATQLKNIRMQISGMGELNQQLILQNAYGIEGADQLDRMIQGFELSALSAADKMKGLNSLIKNSSRGGMDALQIRMAAEKIGLKDVFDMDGLVKARAVLEKSSADELNQTAISLAERIRGLQSKNPELSVDTAFSMAAKKIGMTMSSINEMGLSAKNIMDKASEATDIQKEELARRRTDTEKNITDAVSKGSSRGEAVIAEKLVGIQGLLMSSFLPVLHTMAAAQSISALSTVGQAFASRTEIISGALEGLKDITASMGMQKTAGRLTRFTDGIKGARIGKDNSGIAARAGRITGKFIENPVKATKIMGRMGGSANILDDVTKHVSGTISKFAGVLGRVGNVAKSVVTKFGPLGTAIGVVLTLAGAISAFNNAAVIFEKRVEDVTLGMRGAAGSAVLLTGVFNAITLGFFDKYLGSNGVLTKKIAHMFLTINSFIPIFSAIGLAGKLLKDALYMLWTGLKNTTMFLLGPLFSAIKKGMRYVEYFRHLFGATMTAINGGIEIGMERIKSAINFDKLVATWEKLKSSIGALFPFLQEGDDLADRLRGKAPGLIKLMHFIADAIGAFAKPIGFVVDVITSLIDNAIVPLTTSVGEFFGSMDGLGSSLRKTLAVVGLIGGAFFMLSSPLGWVVAALGVLTYALMKVPSFLEGFMEPFSYLGDMLADVAAPLGKTFGELGSTLTEAFGEITGIFADLFDVGMELLSPFTELYDKMFGASDATDKLGNSISKTIGQVIGSGVVMFITGTVKVLVKVITEVVRAITIAIKIISVIATVIRTIFKMIGAYVKLAKDLVGGLSGALGAALQGEMGVALDYLKMPFKNFSKNVNKVADGMFLKLYDKFVGIGTMIKDNLKATFYDPFIDVVSTIAAFARNAFAEAFNSIINLIPDFMINKKKYLIPTNAPAFADGGIVPGTGTGDRVIARLTPGERVLSPVQTAAFDALMNSFGRVSARDSQKKEMDKAAVSPIASIIRTMIAANKNSVASSGLSSMGQQVNTMLDKGTSGGNAMMERTTKALLKLKDSMLEAMMGQIAAAPPEGSMRPRGTKFSQANTGSVPMKPMNMSILESVPPAVVKEAARKENVTVNNFDMLAKEQKKTNDLLEKLIEAMRPREENRSGGGMKSRSGGMRSTDPFSNARLGNQLGV